MRTALGCVAATAAAVFLAAPAGAGPECTDTAPNTRICRTLGHAGISTSPDPAMSTPNPVWGFGGIGIPAIVLGGGGFWIGF